jgi:catechol 2,3-dioxygenase-like lactoylglutathione lyase family enzyme
MIRLQHVSIPIREGAQDEGRAFYREVLGLVEKAPPAVLAPSGVVWFAAGADGDEREIHLVPDPPGLTPTARRHFCLEVDDLDAFRARLDAAGIETYDQAAIPNRPRFFCRDPFGNLVEVLAIEGPYR